MDTLIGLAVLVGVVWAVRWVWQVLQMPAATPPGQQDRRASGAPSASGIRHVGAPRRDDGLADGLVLGYFLFRNHDGADADHGMVEDDEPWLDGGEAEYWDDVENDFLDADPDDGFGADDWAAGDGDAFDWF